MGVRVAGEHGPVGLAVHAVLVDVVRVLEGAVGVAVEEQAVALHRGEPVAARTVRHCLERDADARTRRHDAAPQRHGHVPRDPWIGVAAARLGPVAARVVRKERLVHGGPLLLGHEHVLVWRAHVRVGHGRGHVRRKVLRVDKELNRRWSGWQRRGWGRWRRIAA